MNRPAVATAQTISSGRWPQGGISSMAACGLGATAAAFAASAVSGAGLVPVLVTATVWLLIGGAVAYGIRTHPYSQFGAANRVTAMRAAITALLAGVVPMAEALPAAAWWGVTALALIALALDGVDGWLARLQGRSSEFGARFDMEIDALLALVMAMLLWRSNAADGWVLALGALRYLFLAAMLVVPALAAPLFPSWRRKAVCVLQIAILAVCLAPSVAPPLSTGLLIAALVALLGSFARDSVWLWARR